MEPVSALTLTHPLVDAVLTQRAALFLGAGASRGATDATGNSIPTAKELGRLLADKFLAGEYRDGQFRTIYDYSVSNGGVRAVQQFLYDQLHAFEPAAHHLIIPTFGWQTIFTTNYDLIIEKAYHEQHARVQTLKALRTDEEAATYLGDPKEDKVLQTSRLLDPTQNCTTSAHRKHRTNNQLPKRTRWIVRYVS